MAIKYLTAKIDYVFKRIFGDKRNVEVLEAFLKAVLKIPEDEYKKLTIVDPHLKKDSGNDKLGILDVKVLTKSNNVIDIEIQVLNIKQMRERIIFYTSKMITEQISSSDKYNKIKRVISIIITDYNLITENDKYHNVYRLYDKDTSSEFTDLIEINTLELPKLPQKEDNSKLWYWLKFLKSNKEEEMKMLAAKDAGVEKAVCVLAELSQDEKERLLAESREKAYRDWQASMDGSFSDGEIKGKIEGKIEMVINLVSSNLINLDTAMDIAKLDKQYKEQIIKKLKVK